MLLTEKKGENNKSCIFMIEASQIK